MGGARLLVSIFRIRVFSSWRDRKGRSHHDWKFLMFLDAMIESPVLWIIHSDLFNSMLINGKISHYLKIDC